MTFVFPLFRLIVLFFSLTGTVPAAGQVDLSILPKNAAYKRNMACSTVDVKQFADVPLSQGEAAMCFAYSTAAMISQRVGFIVSPLDVATTFYLTDARKLKLSSSRLVRDQFKSDRELSSKLTNSQNSHDVGTDGNIKSEPFIDKLEGGEEDAAALLSNTKALCLEKDLPSYDGFEKHMGYISQVRRLGLHLPARMTFRNLVGAPALVRKSAAADYVNSRWVEYVDANCKRLPSPVPILPVIYRTADDQEALEKATQSKPNNDTILRIIDYALDKKRHPVVGYSYYLLQNRLHDDPDRFADHSSLIVARKKIADKCHYLIEDNSGEFCHRFKATFHGRCEFGRIWLSEDEISSAVYSVVYLR